ncbi:hypothetical protein [Vibrio parahaemolyticus]
MSQSDMYQMFAYGQCYLGGGWRGLSYLPSTRELQQASATI